MDEIEEWSRFMGRRVSPLEIFTLKREVTALLTRQQKFNAAYHKERDGTSRTHTDHVGAERHGAEERPPEREAS